MQYIQTKSTNLTTKLKIKKKETVLGLQQHWEESTEVSKYLNPLPRCRALPTTNILPPGKFEALVINSHCHIIGPRRLLDRVQYVS